MLSRTTNWSVVAPYIGDHEKGRFPARLILPSLAQRRLTCRPEDRSPSSSHTETDPAVQESRTLAPARLVHWPGTWMRPYYSQEDNRRITYDTRKGMLRSEVVFLSGPPAYPWTPTHSASVSIICSRHPVHDIGFPAAATRDSLGGCDMRDAC